MIYFYGSCCSEIQLIGIDKSSDTVKKNKTLERFSVVIHSYVVLCELQSKPMGQNGPDVAKVQFVRYTVLW